MSEFKGINASTITLSYNQIEKFPTELFASGSPISTIDLSNNKMTSIPEYSLINQGHEFFLDRQYADSLVNDGTGHNYGIELTLERFLYRNYFFLFTTSLFKSEYRGWDQEIRSTAFDVNYVLNAVGGYEFKFGKRKRSVMSFGIRATWSGGNPYIPYDVEQTVATGEPVYDWKNSFTCRYPDYKRR